MELTYIHKEEKNIKLRYVLRDKLYISNVLLKKLKDANAIFVNGNITFVNYEVKFGDIVKVDLKYLPKDTPSVVPTKGDLDILYEDEYILAINKPSGIDIHPCMANFSNSIANYIMYYFCLKNYNISKIHIITRLDKNTSGVCIVAKNEYIKELFLRKKDDIMLKKEYIAVCHGILDKEHFFIEKYIRRKDNSIILREAINTELPDSEYAKTEVFVDKVNKERNYTICTVILHTGRTHQIRVHFLSIDHPLLGDDLYTKDLSIHSEVMKYIKRQALHSFRVTFNHPITGAKVSICSNIPDDIAKLQ